jgi:hypothetical protein
MILRTRFPDMSNLAIQWQEMIWIERLRQFQVNLVLDNRCLTAEEKRKKKKKYVTIKKNHVLKKRGVVLFCFPCLVCKGSC